MHLFVSTLKDFDDYKDRPVLTEDELFKYSLMDLDNVEDLIVYTYEYDPETKLYYQIAVREETKKDV